VLVVVVAVHQEVAGPVSGLALPGDPGAVVEVVGHEPEGESRPVRGKVLLGDGQDPALGFVGIGGDEQPGPRRADDADGSAAAV